MAFDHETVLFVSLCNILKRMTVIRLSLMSIWNNVTEIEANLFAVTVHTNGNLNEEKFKLKSSVK